MPYYNGVKLPELPAEALAENPCCFIRAPGSTASPYYAWFSKYPWYCTGTYFYIKASSYKYYVANATDTAWRYAGGFTDNGRLSIDGGVVWTNTDIYTSNAYVDVYFAATAILVPFVPDMASFMAGFWLGQWLKNKRLQQ